MKNIEKFIIDFFIEKNAFTEEEANRFLTIDYFDASFLDSIEFVMLITELEETFNISFSQEQIQSKDFRTINGLQNIVKNNIIIGKNLNA